MIEIDKKQYIAPQMRSNELKANTILAGSDLTGGGDNDQPGAPSTAEGKQSSIWNSIDGDE